MKDIVTKLIFGFVLIAAVSSCIKEDVAPIPSMEGIKIYMTDITGADSLVTEVVEGSVVKFVVASDADMCAVWPGGTRNIMKKKGSPDVDSLDMFNNPVLVVSDQFSDYGLVGARGMKTTLSPDGWYCTYTYPKAGQFDMVVVVTNHGYNNDNFQQVIHELGKITVRAK